MSPYLSHSLSPLSLGHIVPDDPADLSLPEGENEEDLEAQKGQMKETAENPIIM